MTEKLKELKAEADSLGVKYSPNIGEAALQSKIESKLKEKYDDKDSDLDDGEDTTAKLLAAAAKAEAKVEEAKPTGKWGKAERRELAAKREKAARKTKVITIIDNDQRVNNQTETCTVNCSNEYFDLGQIILPLNTKVEVMQGHIDAIKSVEIVNHVKDPVTKMSRHVLRPRYTISYEQEQPV